MMVFVTQSGRERIAARRWSTVGIGCSSHRVGMTRSNLFRSGIPHKAVIIRIETVEHLTGSWLLSISLLLLLLLLLLWRLLLLLLLLLRRNLLMLSLLLLGPVSRSSLRVEDTRL